MNRTSRRDLILTATSLAVSSAGTSPALQAASAKPNDAASAPLVHIAFFWLKNQGSKEDLARLVSGLKGFADVETVRGIHVGVPDMTRQRSVVDSSYSASVVMYFDNLEGYKAHITHPAHDKFAAECGPLIQRAVVYDPKSG